MKIIPVSVNPCFKSNDLNNNNKHMTKELQRDTVSFGVNTAAIREITRIKGTREKAMCISQRHKDLDDCSELLKKLHGNLPKGTTLRINFFSNGLRASSLLISEANRTARYTRYNFCHPEQFSQSKADEQLSKYIAGQGNGEIAFNIPQELRRLLNVYFLKPPFNVSGGLQKVVEEVIEPAKKSLAQVTLVLREKRFLNIPKGSDRDGRWVGLRHRRQPRSLRRPPQTQPIA